MSPPVLLLALLVLAVASAGGYAGASLIDAASQSQVRLAAARDNLDGLVRVQLSQETGLRGFLASGQRSFLAEQNAPDQTFAARSKRLEAELINAHLPDQVAALRRLDAWHRRWVGDVEGPLLDDPARGNALALQREGKTITDQMNDEAVAMREALTAAGVEVGHTLRFRINLVVAGSVTAIAVFAIAVLVLALSRTQAMQALAREQSLVSALQQTLRVDGTQLPGTRLGFAYTSATREALVGGDLIDSWMTSRRTGWFLIADASGKGIEAARHSAFVQYAVRALTAEYDDPADVLVRFNRLFLSTFDDPSIFVVVFLGTFDTGTRVLRYASAGHATAFIKSAMGVDQLPTTGSIVGLDPDEPYATATRTLASGDSLVLATDGLTECRDAAGDMIGDEGVLAMLRSTAGSPQAICDTLVAEARRRSRGEVTDDLAILVVEVVDRDSRAARVPFTTMTS